MTMDVQDIFVCLRIPHSYPRLSIDGVRKFESTYEPFTIWRYRNRIDTRPFNSNWFANLVSVIYGPSSEHPLDSAAQYLLVIIDKGN